MDVIDPYNQALDETGCAHLNEMVQLCYYEKKDWRQCQKELDTFRKCYQEFERRTKNDS